MAIDYVFWLTGDISERATYLYAKKITEKIRNDGFYAVPVKIIKDFMLIDYKKSEKEKLESFKEQVTFELIEKYKEKFDGTKMETLHLNEQKPKNELDIEFSERINEYKREHPEILEQIPIKEGQLFLMIRFNKASFPYIEKLLKNNKIQYTRVTEWLDNEYLPPECTQVIENCYL